MICMVKNIVGSAAGEFPVGNIHQYWCFKASQNHYEEKNLLVKVRNVQLHEWQKNMAEKLLLEAQKSNKSPGKQSNARKRWKGNKR